MRQLRSCDFCDAGDTLGVYEVVPDHLEGAAERRLVLCSDCRDRLDWVLEPFLDHIDDDSDASAGDEDVTLLGVTQSSSRSSHGPTDSGEGTSSGGEPGSTSGDRADSDTALADESEAGGDEGDAADAPTDSPSVTPSGPSAADRAADDTPPKYRQVMRFLGNRDLPIDRAEAESLASGAYDLEAGEATDIIDVALERGLLVEENGQLRSA